LIRDPAVSAVAFNRDNARYVFAVRQRLHDDAQAMMASLQARGIAVEIVSGDREPAVRAAAQSLGICGPIMDWGSGGNS